MGHFGQHSPYFGDHFPYVWVTLDSTNPTSGVTLDNTDLSRGSFRTTVATSWVTSDNTVPILGITFPTCGSLWTAQTLHRGSLWTTQTLVAGRFGQQPLRRGSLWTTQSPRLGSCGTTSWVISDKTVPASGVTLDNTVPTSQGFVWKFFYALYINFHSFIHSYQCVKLH